MSAYVESVKARGEAIEAEKAAETSTMTSTCTRVDITAGAVARPHRRWPVGAAGECH